MKTKIILFIVLITVLGSLQTIRCFAQQGVSINTTGNPPANCAILDISSSTKGLLIPRVSLTDVTVYSPLIGTPITSLLVYSSTAPIGGGGAGFYYWSGTQWVQALGATGVTGPTGAAGSNGATGADGATGLQGPTGPQGTAGTNGSSGTQGIQGPTGPIGPTGTVGTNGSNGTQGIQGPTGPQGTAGTNGSNGTQGIQGPIGPTGTAGTNGSNGAQGIQGLTGLQGPTGLAGPVGCENNNYVLKSNGSSAVCTDGPIYEDGSGNVEIGGSSPNSKLQVNGSLSLPTLSVSSSYTITNNDYTIITKGSTAFTIYLPNPATCSGRIIRIVRLYNPSTAITMQVTGGGSTILPPGYGGTPTNTYSLNTTMQAWQSDGTNWVEIQ